MVPLPPLELARDEMAAVLRKFGLAGSVCILGPGAGTASQAAIIRIANKDFYLKRRNPRYCAPEWMWYDAEVAWHLREIGLPVAAPLRAKDGKPWAEVGGHVYQIAPMLGGKRQDNPSCEQLRQVGEILSRWHQATACWRPSVAKPVGRLHDPKQAIEWLSELSTSARGSDAKVLYEARQWGERVEVALPDDIYWSLPRVVVHGDVHPANVHFGRNRVVGVFDYDWVCEAPRATDLADALIYMAGRRVKPLRDGDIRSLTQAFVLELERVQAVMHAYGEELTEEEQRAMPWLLLARWIYSRADAAIRKIPESERVAYLVDGFLAPVDEINAASLAMWGEGLQE
jgi:homoserine kinase type II